MLVTNREYMLFGILQRMLNMSDDELADLLNYVASKEGFCGRFEKSIKELERREAERMCSKIFSQKNSDSLLFCKEEI